MQKKKALSQPDNPAQRPMLSLSQYIDFMNKGLGSLQTTHYHKNTKCLLADLCERYGSDKGVNNPENYPFKWLPHTYTDYYSRLFAHCRQHIHSVFECGIGTNNPELLSSMGENGKPGASLRVWRDYFPQAKVIGADIDKEILFSEERIATYYVDQTNPDEIQQLWQEVEQEHFDLMIDDGLHTFAAGVCLFEHSIHKLAEHGIYIIEDVAPHDLVSFKHYFMNKPYQVDYVNLIHFGRPLGDNNLVVVRHLES